MDLAKHLPSLDPSFRAALEAMTDPEPEKRPQRGRDVVALLAKRARDDKAMTAPGTTAFAPRRLFGDVQEPLGTLMRLGVLTFGAGGWIGMAGVRLSLALVVTIIAMLSFPKRVKVRAVGKEIDSMLSEGQSGFTDMMRGAMARERRR